MRGATYADEIAVLQEREFQPTRPLRGATEHRVDHLVRQLDFNPRAPCGARRAASSGAEEASEISTHAPLAGRDAPPLLCHNNIEAISTHAPLAGRDNCATSCVNARGEFQPTRPLRGATSLLRGCNKSLTFQPTRPLRGATNLRRGSGIFLIRFQPTRPLRGATSPLTYRLTLVAISTHAPLAGRDYCVSCPACSVNQFQPTRPLRGATLSACNLVYRVSDFNPRAPCGARQQKCTNHYAHFCDNRQISDAFAQNAACQGILLLFDAGKPCGFWVRTAQVISAHLCFAL